MKKLFITLAVCLLSFSLNAQPKGHLFIIGGGVRSDSMITEYLRLAGGSKARVLVLPYATEEAAFDAPRQAMEFKMLGAEFAEPTFFTREQLDTEEGVKLLENKTAVFFCGGDQAKLTAVVLGTKFYNKMKEFYMNGGVIGGTSAGAAVMSKIMITGNEITNKDSNRTFASIHNNNVEVQEGFGFLDNVIIDQHFVIRKRLNRLLSVIYEYGMPGIGIDEATAVVVSEGRYCRVVGWSNAVIVEPDINQLKRHGLKYSTKDTKLHILYPGDTYDIQTRKVTLK